MCIYIYMCVCVILLLYIYKGFRWWNCNILSSRKLHQVITGSMGDSQLLWLLWFLFPWVIRLLRSFFGPASDPSGATLPWRNWRTELCRALQKWRPHPQLERILPRLAPRSMAAWQASTWWQLFFRLEAVSSKKWLHDVQVCSSNDPNGPTSHEINEIVWPCWSRCLWRQYRGG